jgi:hypothetical protein
MRKFFQEIIKSQFLFFVFVLIFVILFLFKQLSYAYIDYGDGTYLYELKLIASGKKLYVDFFAPQPPLFYFFGYLIYLINPSIIFFRFILLLINIFSLYLFYLFIKKSLNNHLAALLTVISTFIFTISIFWWPTFTGEIFLRLFISLLLYLEIFVKKNKFIYLKSLLLIIIFFIKYSSFFFIFFYFLFLFLSNKKMCKQVFIYSAINFLLINFFLFLLFRSDMYYQTIILRRILPLKPLEFSIHSTIYFLVKFIPFYALNFLIGFQLFTKKKHVKSLIFFSSIFWLPNLFFNFIEGTYLYIFYPLEPIIATGFFYYLFNKNLKEIKFNKLVRLTITFFTFWCVLVLIYQLQSFPNFYYLRSNNFDVKTTEEIIKMINESDEKFIIAPPFFLYFSKKQSYDNFHDPFFFLYYLINPSNFKFKYFEKLRKNLLSQKPNQIFVDWRIKKILLKLDTNYFKQYKLNKTFNFLINPNETIEIFVKTKD